MNEKKIWTPPTSISITKDVLKNISKRILTVESSLYASGCHSGMRTRY